MKVLWIVNHGVNYSHLYETEIFNTKRESVSFFNSIKERAAKLIRWTDTTDKVICERKIGVS